MENHRRVKRLGLIVILLWGGAACLAVDRDAVVKAVAQAHKKGRLIDPVSHTFGVISMDEAYHIQKTLARRLRLHAGPLAGYKVAYASVAAQKQFGMTEPARGPFYLSQRVPSGAVLPAETFKTIMLETEIGFTIGKRINKPIKDVAELKSHVKWVHTVFDAGNFPYQTDKAKPVPADMVASGTGAHIFVFGPPRDPSQVDLKNLTTTLYRNKEKIREAPAQDIMGDPWQSLLWCANHLHQYGLTLEPGMVVFSGTAAKAYKVSGEDIKGTYVGDCGPLGTVTMTLK